MLVVDDTQGLIVSAMLERMGGFGQLVAVHEGDFHNYDILRYMNFPKAVIDTLYTVPLVMIDPETPSGKKQKKSKSPLCRYQPFLYIRDFRNYNR